MAEDTAIQWATHTFNPWRGCARVAAGCKHCYAAAWAERSPTMFGKWGSGGTRVVAAEATWKQPIKWERDAETTAEAWPEDRPRVFCASLADVFEQWPGQLQYPSGQWAVVRRHWGQEQDFAPCPLRGGNDAVTLDVARRRIFRLIDATPSLDWLLVTKRPENILRMWTPKTCESCGEVSCGAHRGGVFDRNYRQNVWLGYSVACQDDLDALPHFLAAKDLAGKLFLSVEPLIGKVVFEPWMLQRLHWLIVGGESGPHARPCAVNWVRSILRQARLSGLPVFVKQLGGRVHAKDAIDPLDQFPGTPQFSGVDRDTIAVRLKDRKGGDPAEWPADLQVREFPTVPRGRKAAL